MLDSPCSTPERQVSRRKFAPKSQTGCLTCRIRRVKCDEGKPCCNRCLSTGRKCDGYPKAVKPIVGTIQPGDPSRTLTTDICTSSFEKQAFRYFCICTAPRLAGYFQDDAWDRIILQMSHTEPAIRHAVNAISGLHREMSDRKRSFDHKEQEVPAFPLEQYTKALQLYRGLLSSGQTAANTLLSCTLLFIHFEALRENFASAILHIENITTILHVMSSFSSRLIHPSIVEALTRVDIQSSVYLGSRVPHLSFWGAEEDMFLPDAFEDINHARRLVNLWTCRMYYFMRTTADRIKYTSLANAPLEVIWESQKLQNVFGKMNEFLHNLERECGPTHASPNKSGLYVLSIRAKLNQVLCMGCLYSEESVYDAYLDEFRSILDMCKSLISVLVAEDRVSSALLDEGLLHPLSFIATSCRDGTVRHEALDQLGNLAAIRRSWHVEVVWRMAQRCIWLEEGTSAIDLKCENIPEWRRVHSHGFESLQNSHSRTIRVKFKYLGNGKDGEWNDHEEVISW